MVLDKRKQFVHAQYVLQYIRSTSIKSNHEADVVVKCLDGEINMPMVVLASLSPLLKTYLQEIESLTTKDPMLILPDVTSSSLSTFLKYLFASNIKHIYKAEHMETLHQMCLLLAVPQEKLPVFFLTPDQPVEEILGLVDDEDPLVLGDEQGAEYPDKRKRPAIIPRSRYGRRRKAKKHHDEETETEEEYKEGEAEEKVVLQPKWEQSNLKCRYCDKQYNHMKARNKHMIGEHANRCKQDGLLFPCEECGTNFVSALGKEKHALRVHATTDRHNAGHNDDETSSYQVDMVDMGFSCPFHPQRTDTSFLNVKELKNHIKADHPEKDKSCIGCGLDCGTRKALLEHIQTHGSYTPEGRSFYNCEHCTRKFLSEYNLVVHKRNEHSTCTTLICKSCGKNFKNAKFLANHEEKHRRGELPTEKPEYVCGQCSKVFSQKANLERHVRTTHKRIKSHTCNECGKNFVDSTRLKEHRWIHTGHKPYACNYCEKSFRHKNHVRHHEANAHGESKKFSCHKCTKSFCYAYQLKTHLTNHNEQDEQKKNNPSGSNTGFFVDVDKITLEQAAAAAHDGEDYVQTLYQCSLCQQVFQNYKDLQDHCSEHTDEELASGTLKKDDTTADANNVTLMTTMDNKKGSVEGLTAMTESGEEIFLVGSLDGAGLSQDNQPYVVQYVFDTSSSSSPSKK